MEKMDAFSEQALHSRHNGIRKGQKKKRKWLKPFLLSLLFLILLYAFIFGSAYYDFINRTLAYELYLSHSWDNWEGIDYSIEGDNIILSREIYMAPHLETDIGNLLQRHSAVAIRTTGRLGGHTGGAYTLMAIRTTAGDTLAVAVDRLGQIALVSDPMIMPDFEESTMFFNGNTLEGEYELLLLIDRGTSNLDLYLDGAKVTSKYWEGADNPVSKLWLGSIWIMGGANYGAPIDHEIYDLVVGSEEMAGAYMTYRGSLLDSMPLWAFAAPLFPWLLFMIIISTWKKGKGEKINDAVVQEA